MDYGTFWIVFCLAVTGLAVNVTGAVLTALVARRLAQRNRELTDQLIRLARDKAYFMVERRADGSVENVARLCGSDPAELLRPVQEPVEQSPNTASVGFEDQPVELLNRHV